MNENANVHLFPFHVNKCDLKMLCFLPGGFSAPSPSIALHKLFFSARIDSLSITGRLEFTDCPNRNARLGNEILFPFEMERNKNNTERKTEKKSERNQ